MNTKYALLILALGMAAGQARAEYVPMNTHCREVARTSGREVVYTTYCSQSGTTYRVDDTVSSGAYRETNPSAIRYSNRNYQPNPIMPYFAVWQPFFHSSRPLFNNYYAAGNTRNYSTNTVPPAIWR